MSGFLRLSHGDRWRFNGQTLRFEARLGDGLLHFIRETSGGPFQLEQDGLMTLPTEEWVMQAYGSGEMTRIPNAHAVAARRAASEREYDPATIQKMDPDAQRRSFILRGFDAMGVVNGSEARVRYALNRLWQDQPAQAAAFVQPHPRTVIRWLEQRGRPGDRPLEQMVSMQGRVPRAQRLPPVLHSLMDRYAARYWSSMGLTITDAFALMASRLFRLNRWRVRAGLDPLTLPSTELFRQRVRKSETPAALAAKWGVKKAASRFKPVQGQLHAARLLALGCMDHTSLDTIAVLDADWMLPVGTPWLTLLVDVRTRCVVGFFVGFEPPSIHSVMECLRRANLPKSVYEDRRGAPRGLANIYGRFDEIIVDNGKEFAGVAMEHTLADLGTTLRLAPVASPQHKAIVERFFGTLNSLLVRKLPGAKLPIQTMRELGYDPQATAVLTVQEVEQLIWEALAIYHLDVHSGIGTPPALQWTKDAEAYGIAVYDSARELEKMLGVPVKRQLSRSGIELHGLQYHDPAAVGALLTELAVVAPQREQRRSGSITCKVTVKYNPANLNEVQVWHHLQKRYVTLPWTEPDYAQGLSLWHHERIKQWTKEAGLRFSSLQDRLEARARMIEQVERLAPELKMRQRRAMARLMHSPANKVSEGLVSGVVEMEIAPSRHDGLAPIIPQVALATERTDGSVRPSRPPRPPSQSKIARARKVKSNDTAPAFPSRLADAPWKEFE